MAWSELAFHAFSVCRFAEELQQMQRVGMSKYISSGWNKIDLATSFLVLAAGLLRLTLVSSIEGELGASVDAWRRPLVEAALPYHQEHTVALNQLTRSILSVVCVMIGLRLLDVFTVSEKLGVLKIILMKMLAKVKMLAKTPPARTRRDAAHDPPLSPVSTRPVPSPLTTPRRPCTTPRTCCTS